ncbi:unnamed protein product, partial [Adineta ricciae]
MTDNKHILANSAKCPFSPMSANGCSSPSTQSDDGADLLWSPQINSVELRNYQTNQTTQVTGPFSKTYGDCRHHVCTSTFMALPAHNQQKQSASKMMIDEIELKSPDYIRKEAYDYMAIFHNENKTSDADYERRLQQIDLELAQTGTYKQTKEELEYGCQLSWRNAGRCINRLFWRSLIIIDCRHVKTNDEMFKEICDHIRFAYNGGTL